MVTKAVAASLVQGGLEERRTPDWSNTDVIGGAADQAHHPADRGSVCEVHTGTLQNRGVVAITVRRRHAVGIRQPHGDYGSGSLSSVVDHPIGSSLEIGRGKRNATHLDDLERTAHLSHHFSEFVCRRSLHWP